MLNASYFGAKRVAISINIHCYVIGKTFSNHSKHGSKGGKISVKKWSFRSKKGVIGLLKFRVYNQTRKAKWCKTQVLLLKTDKTKVVKGQKWWLIACF